MQYIINHVFLPPKLPQKDDSKPENDHALTEECETALRSCQNYFPRQDHRRLAACTKTLKKMLELRDLNGDMISERLEKFRAQNAGLIVRRMPQQVSFESFELSPTDESVMTTKGRLRRCFPGPAVAIALERMAESSLRQALAQLITKLDVNTPSECWSIVTKAKSEAIEVRETVHP
jgi:hypothetical protein